MMKTITKELLVDPPESIEELRDWCQKHIDQNPEASDIKLVVCAGYEIPEFTLIIDRPESDEERIEREEYEREQAEIEAENAAHEAKIKALNKELKDLKRSTEAREKKLQKRIKDVQNKLY